MTQLGLNPFYFAWMQLFFAKPEQIVIKVEIFELTLGMENIFLNGTMLGFSEEEINARLDEILSFADIGDFIHQPVKTYSSGMFVRLAFAVAINIDPEILVVDEALSVGDVFFQAKCYLSLIHISEPRDTR